MRPPQPYLHSRATGTVPRVSVDPRAGQLPEDRDLVDLDALLAAYHEHPPTGPSRSARPGTAARRSTARSPRRTWSRSAPRSAATGRAGDERAALPRPRHARPVRARVPHDRRGARRARRRGRRRRRRRLHADAGDLARDPHPQPRREPRQPAGRRRDRRDALAQPAGRRRLQVQPAARRAGRHRRHRLDRARGQPAARAAGSTTSPACRSTTPRSPGATTSPPTSTTSRR